MKNDQHWNKRVALRADPLPIEMLGIAALSPFPIVTPGEQTTMTITMGNRGYPAVEPR